MQETNALSLAYLERLWADYSRDPRSVGESWRRYFDRLAAGARRQQTVALGPSFRPPGLFGGAGINGHPRLPTLAMTDVLPADHATARIQCLLDDLVDAYRVQGHRAAQIDPLGMPRPDVPELDPTHYGLSEADLDRPLPNGRNDVPGMQTLRSVIERVRNTYCRSIGVQFMHIDELAVRGWLQQRMESTENRLQLSRPMQLRILTRLTDAALFEEFLRRNYVGATSFSLEGSETLIPLLDLAIEKAALQGVVEIVFGMAHRGRLSVLTNIIGKRLEEIFWEFQEGHCLPYERGDVRYHLGYSNDWQTESGASVHLSLCFNPSHLEYVNPVALGRMRAKLDRTDSRPERGLVVLIHGDASFAGEGIVQETLNLSQLPAYTTGGALHIIVNNQLGFTTSPAEGRSSEYATAVAQMLQIPVFHVNGEDPEAVAQVVELSLDFRKRFGRDVVIDVYGYRRWGHNEGDEPSYTQPLVYRQIEHRPSVRDSYLEKLLDSGGVTREEADEIADRRRQQIAAEFESSQAPSFRPRIQALGGNWSGYLGGPEPADDEATTTAPRELLASLLEKLTQFPDDFHPHPKLERFFEARRAMARGERPLDWSAAEALALASLAVEGHPVRLTGQDSARGTFSQRHGVLIDHDDGHPWCPFSAVSDQQQRVEIYNTPLSEAGVLGFEYGYSLDQPSALVVWEAQYGDFWNAAQVIVDQFIASAEQKWYRLSGLVLLLPHGFEGQGPEHSSARLERFLALAAGDNIQVVQPSTPAQYFHCLRRQVKRRWRKPLVVLTPKGMLRHPAMTSSLDDCAAGGFARVLPDDQPRRQPPSRVLLASGKFYHELHHARQQRAHDDVMLLRVEQFYPLPHNQLLAALRGVPDGTHVYWAQEEPANMGAWPFLCLRLGEEIGGRLPLSCFARPVSSSPATGSHRVHAAEQKALINAIFGD